MPFLAPIVPFLPEIGGAVAGLFGGGKPGRDSSEQQIYDLQRQLAQLGAQGFQKLYDWTGQLEPTAQQNLQQVSNWLPSVTQGIQNTQQVGQQGQGFLNQAQSAFTPALNYYTNVLAGGPQAMMALSPAIQQANSSFNQIRNQASQFGPSGGGRSALLAQLPYQRAAAVSNIYSQAQPAAAQGLSSLGGTIGGLGSALTGQATGLTGSLAGDLSGLTGNLVNGIMNAYASGGAGATSGLQGMMQNEMLRRQLGTQQGTNLGTGVFNILKGVLGGFGGSGGGVNPSTVGSLPVGDWKNNPFIIWN